jgi:PPOX class probable F420-dependent enzyme
VTGFVETDSVPIPATHIDLLTRPICGVLTTMGRDGHPHSGLTRVGVDDGYARFTTTLEGEEGRDLLANPKVSLLVVDPDDTARFIQIRGEVELVTDGAVDHVDVITGKHARHPAYDGHIHPSPQQARETRVTCRIHARRVTLDAIHASR